MKKKDIIYILILISLIVVGYLRYKNREYSIIKGRLVFDTFVQISAKSKLSNIEAIVDSTFILMERYDKMFSYYDKSSILSQINEKVKSQIPMDYFKLLEFSKKMYIQSDSLFDITIGSLVDIWDFEKGALPTEAQIKEALKGVGFHKVFYDSISLNKPQDVKLNFGALAKGYIVDKSVKFLKNSGVVQGYVNAGGDIKFFGDKKQKVGIRDPRAENGLIRTLNVKNVSVVTSGDYERYFIKDSIRYHHILNPKTGYPQHKVISTTVITKDAYKADALSTALFLMGGEKAIEYIDTLAESEAIIFFLVDGKVTSVQSKNMQKYIVE